MKILNFKESLHSITDILRINKENITPNKNYIRILDKNTGRVLINRRENIITHRGRTFALEKLYKDVNDSTDYPIKNYDRKINLFSVGDGGCPVGDPFSPIIPSPLDLELANKVPFITIPVGIDPVDIYPDIVMSNYPTVPEVVSGNNIYYYKRFNILEPEWFIDRATNTVYKKVELILNIEDCRNEYINELSLFFSTDTFTDIEMYSRVTFPTEAITGSKLLVVEYYTFA